MSKQKPQRPMFVAGLPWHGVDMFAEYPSLAGEELRIGKTALQQCPSRPTNGDFPKAAWQTELVALLCVGRQMFVSEADLACLHVQHLLGEMNERGEELVVVLLY